MALDRLYEVYPDMDTFLNEFPILKKHVLECKSTGEQVIRLNKVIVNIRGALGWEIKNETFEKYVVDMSTDENMAELSKFDSPPLLILVLKCMVSLLNGALDVLNDLQKQEDIIVRQSAILAMGSP